MSTHATNPPTDPPPAARRASAWRTFSLLALIEFVVVLDTSIVNVALPSIQRDLGFTATGLAWVVDAYLLTFAGFLLIGGRAADLVGRRRLFLTGLGIFTLASITNGVATSAWPLVLSRAVQGLGGALVVPAAIALLSDLFDDQKDRAKALGIFSGMGGVAGAIGVVAGGLLTSVSWHWIFFINVPVGATVLLLAVRKLPSGAGRASGGIDALGAASGTGGLTLLILGMVQGGHQGWTSPSTLGVFTASSVLLAVFLTRQRTAKDPMVPTPLLRHREVLLGNAAMVIVGTLMFGTFFIITLYMQHVRGLEPHQAGLLYLPISIALITGTQLAPRLAMRFGRRNTLAAGLAVQTIGLAWWALSIDPDATVLTQFLAPTVLWGLGAGISLVSAFILCTTTVTGPLAGAASGLATTSQNAGGAVGLAALVAIADARSSSLATPDHLSSLTSGYAAALGVAATLGFYGLLLVQLRGRRGAPATRRRRRCDKPSAAGRR